MLHQSIKFIILIIFSIQSVIAQTQILLPFTPGGGTDIVYHMFSQYCNSRQVKISSIYKPGANGLIGTMTLSTMDPNGKTLGLMGADTIQEVIQKYPNIKFEYIGTVATPTMVLVTGANSTITSYDKLEEMSTKKQLSFGYSSNNQLVQVNQLISKLKKTDHIIVPYQGGNQVLTNIMGGHIDLSIIAASAVMEHVLSGKLRLLASSDKITGISTVVFTEKYKDWKKHRGYVLIMPYNSPKELVTFWTNLLNDFVNDNEIKLKLNNIYLY
jgi:tripartite-type tricarboxylate transporter receptor subunit TctC